MTFYLKNMLSTIAIVEANEHPVSITKVKKFIKSDIDERLKCFFIISDIGDKKRIEVFIPAESKLYYTQSTYDFNKEKGIKKIDLDMDKVLPQYVFQKAYDGDELYVAELNRPVFAKRLKGFETITPTKRKEKKNNITQLENSVRKMF